MLAAPADASIIGTDDRYQIGNTTVHPYSAVVEIVLPSGFGACTGWMYAPNMVATAGHCVYDAANGWLDTRAMKVWPGINGSTATAPYGSCGVVKSYAPAGWTNGQNEAFDYAALRLDCTVGNQTGVLNYGLQPTVGYQTRVCGYPSDKPTDTQWCGDDQVRAADAYQVFYANDTIRRMSGGPVLGYTSSGWSVIAIHTMNVHGTAPNHSSYNHGTRITATVSNDLSNWQYYG
jgi:glutamyl endopeptidase